MIFREQAIYFLAYLFGQLPFAESLHLSFLFCYLFLKLLRITSSKGQLHFLPQVILSTKLYDFGLVIEKDKCSIISIDAWWSENTAC